MRTLCLLAVCIALIAPFWDSAAADSDVSSLIEQGDAAWEKRGTDGAVENRRAADLFLSAVEAAPFNYEAHWKAARSLWWLADQALLVSDDKHRQRELGRQAMDLAGRAVLISPDGVQGRLYRAMSALHYCYGIGMVQALKEGIQEEAARHLIYCYEEDAAAEGGLVFMGLSTLYRTASWPIRDKNKSVAYAREAVSVNPAGIRAAVFLATALAAAGSYEESMELLTRASEMDGDAAREPDYKWWKRFARTCVNGGKVPDPDKIR
ncbi:MAG: hypothetical protein JW765_02055 [Deltaproteobacteria bacterium]|nr:hypothetical protein [Candidatus Zymogenaceae bacterium]